jgi:hypothetical protein
MIVRPSPLSHKKWRASFKDGTHTDFGNPEYEDYTQHHDEERRRLYRIRHKKDLETKDPKRAGFLSYYILWGDSTSREKNIQKYKMRFGDL